MNFKRNLGDVNHFITRTFMLVVSLFTTLPFAAYSIEDSYQLTKVALLEHKVGDDVEVNAPAGVLRFKILKIEY